jgi:uncharacterized membrane protein YphA (DoxX/SURF4 family)
LVPVSGTWLARGVRVLAQSFSSIDVPIVHLIIVLVRCMAVIERVELLLGAVLASGVRARFVAIHLEGVSLE